MSKRFYLLVHAPSARDVFTILLPDAVARKEAARLLLNRGRSPITMKLTGQFESKDTRFKVVDSGEDVLMVKVFPEHALRVSKLIVAKLNPSVREIGLQLHGNTLDLVARGAGPSDFVK